MQKLIFLLMLSGIFLSITAQASPSFVNFDRRARKGENLNIVFFGASLTWGANSTDPQRFSYRPMTAKWMEEMYPKAHFHYFDAAIGGTSSSLSVFRLQRDVLDNKPDLVFLDFSLNDNPFEVSPVFLPAYESLLRRLILEGNVPVVQMILVSKSMVTTDTAKDLPLFDIHRDLAVKYHIPTGDAFALIRKEIAEGRANPDVLWPSSDATHPGNPGYALYAEAAKQGFLKGVKGKMVCTAPKKMINPETYLTWSRIHLAKLPNYPFGWKAGVPNRISAYYDMLMSRWLDDELVAVPGADPLVLKFKGTFVQIFGESTPTAGKYRAKLDDGEWKEFDSGAIGHGAHGNAHHVAVIASDLAPNTEHTLVIEPLLKEGEELRLESLCIAGK